MEKNGKGVMRLLLSALDNPVLREFGTGLCPLW